MTAAVLDLVELAACVSVLVDVVRRYAEAGLLPPSHCEGERIAYPAAEIHATRLLVGAERLSIDGLSLTGPSAASRSKCGGTRTRLVGAVSVRLAALEAYLGGADAAGGRPPRPYRRMGRRDQGDRAGRAGRRDPAGCRPSSTPGTPASRAAGRTSAGSGPPTPSRHPYGGISARSLANDELHPCQDQWRSDRTSSRPIGLPRGGSSMTRSPDIHVTVDGFGHIAGARFVDPDEYLEHAPGIVRGSMVDTTLVEALAAAADSDGALLDFQIVEFYEQHVTAVMRDDEDDPADWRLNYSRFVAMALTDATYRLATAGLLAQRGNGDSYDYRLTLPGETAAG